jgi:hypothetical protein
MKILTLDNRSFDLNNLPDEIDDIRFNVLDNSNPMDPDFYFLSLIFLESFSSPAILLDIGGYQIAMPLEWSILIGDVDSNVEPEVMPLTSINERGFDAFIFNPVTGFKAEFVPVNIVNIFQDIVWHFPKLRSGNFLTIPLNDNINPPCAFFIKDVPKLSEILKLEKIL